MSSLSDIIASYNQQDLKNRLESILTMKFFMDISEIPDDDDEVLNYINLLKMPVDILNDYLKKCKTRDEELIGYSIFLEIIIGISNETTRKDAWFDGLDKFITVHQKDLDNIFGLTIDFLMDEIKIIYPADEDDHTFAVEATEFGESIFSPLYFPLEESENFLLYGGDYISDKYYEFLNHVSTFEDN